jgi:nicotinate-nucleotide adenylyltransferase
MKREFKIGLFGGSFNPPHIGHLLLATKAQEDYKLGIVYFIPINKPPTDYKSDKDFVEPFHRLNMVKHSVENNEYFHWSDCDIRRGGTTYTIDTIKNFHSISEKPKIQLYFICGEDSYNTLHTWKDSEEIKKAVEFIVFKRSGELELGISSSLIRKRIKKGLSIKYMVHDNVIEYIKRNALYKHSV